MQPSFRGPIAALLTARKSDGSIDHAGVERNIELVLSHGVKGVVVCGGTGEYADMSNEQRRLLLQHVSAVNRDRGYIICSNGAMRLADSVALAEHALALGADAVLLPPPHFFRYNQPDLEDFYREAAKRIKGPVLIYNLPFTSLIEPETTVKLINSVDNIVGVKDSSGSLATLEALEGREDVCRILGNDKVLAEALRRNLIDAVISGPAGVVPEIVVALFAAIEAKDDKRFEKLAVLFDDIIEKTDSFAYPWALKLIAAKREIFSAELPFALSKTRQKQAEALEDWFEDWMEQVKEVE